MGWSQSLSGTINQLLGYATWRDTKIAIVIFNRDKNFSAVLAAIKPTIEAHPNHKRTLVAPRDTWFRFIIAQKDDANREMIMTVLAFDVPQPGDVP